METATVSTGWHKEMGIGNKIQDRRWEPTAESARGSDLQG